MAEVTRDSYGTARQRQKLVGVRLNPQEFALLVAASEREGKSFGSLLREAFLEQERQRGSDE